MIPPYIGAASDVNEQGSQDPHDPVHANIVDGESCESELYCHHTHFYPYESLRCSSLQSLSVQKFSESRG